MRALLIRELDLETTQVYECNVLVDLTGLFSIVDLPRADLHDPPFTPVTHPLLANPDVDIFSALRSADVLLHHPYHSFASSVVEFIQRAADDPHVLAIKITIYRTSGDSPIIDALAAAVEQGKQVAVLVELKPASTKGNIDGRGSSSRRACTSPTSGRFQDPHQGVMVIRDDPMASAVVHIVRATTTKHCHTLRRPRLLLPTPRGRRCHHLFTSHWLWSRYRVRHVVGRARHTSQEPGRVHRQRNPQRRRTIIMKMNSLVDPALIDRLYLASSAESAST